MTNIRIVLADDHPLIRAGIRALLNSIAEVEVVGEASNGREALELIAQHQPQVAIMDISMPEMNGLETTRRITHDFPDVRVLIVSMHATEEYVCHALRAGAMGYLLKDAETEELALAIQAVFNGQMYLTPAVSKESLDRYMQRLGNEADGADILTPRQREVLQLIAEGRTTKEIARVLGISVKTVETHRAQLTARLNIDDIPGLVRYAMRTGLISPEK